MYYDDELYEDGRHCECGELFDDYGYCPACDGDGYLYEWDYQDEIEEIE